MKLRLKKDEFSNLLTTVLPAVSTRSTLPTLSHFLIDAEKDNIKVYATDLEIGIESSLSVKVEKEGSATLPAKSLSDMVRVIDSEEFTLQNLTQAQFEISTPDRNTTFNILGGEKDEFPVLPQIKEEKTAELDAQKFKEGIEKTTSSVSKDESRYVLCGIFFETNDKEFKMVSTDGRRLSFYKNIVNKKLENFSAIIPTKAINVLERSITENDKKIKVSISLTENQIYFTLGNTIIYSRMIEGDYPNYTQVIPEKPNKNIIINTNEMLNATRKMMAVTTERSMAVKYRFKDNKGIISVVAPETGSGTSTIPIIYDGEDIEIAFNPEFVINILKVIKSDKIKLGLSTPINPGKIIPESKEENYIGVIMPMRP